RLLGWRCGCLGLSRAPPPLPLPGERPADLGAVELLPIGRHAVGVLVVGGLILARLGDLGLELAVELLPGAREPELELLVAELRKVVHAPPASPAIVRRPFQPCPGERRPQRTVRWRGALGRRPLRGRLLGPPLGAPARLDAPPHLQGGRIGARARGRRRIQAAELRRGLVAVLSSSFCRAEPRPATALKQWTLPFLPTAVLRFICPARGSGRVGR